MEAKPQTPLARTHHCEDPPFLPSIKGSSLRSGGTWGGPQEMAFLRAEAAGFRALTWAAHANSGSPAHACLGSPDPPFRGHSSSTGSLGTCPWTQQPSLPPREPRDFPWATLPSSSPSSSETVCAGKTWGSGAWAGDFPGGCLRARRPLSPSECPSRPLTPAGDLIPAISGPVAPWGWDTWALCASTWRTWRQTRRPLRPIPTTAKIPLFFPA